MAYRKNVSDKQQVDLEQFCDKGGQSLSWWQGDQTAKRVLMPRQSVGIGCLVGATNAPYDAATHPTPNLAYYPLAAQRLAPAAIISHNDKPWRFENPGKA